MAVINGLATGLSYIASQGNINTNNRLHSHINRNNTRNFPLQRLGACYQQRQATDPRMRNLSQYISITEWGWSKKSVFSAVPLGW